MFAAKVLDTEPSITDAPAQSAPVTPLALASNWHNLLTQELERVTDTLNAPSNPATRPELHTQRAILLQARETYEKHLRRAVQDAVRATAADLIFGFNSTAARTFVNELLKPDADGNPARLADFWKA